MTSDPPSASPRRPVEEIKRYWLVYEDGLVWHMEDPNGRWVEWSDVCALLTESQRLVEQVQTLERERAHLNDCIGELLQVAAARTSERDQAREAIKTLETWHAEQVAQLTREKAELLSCPDHGPHLGFRYCPECYQRAYAAGHDAASEQTPQAGGGDATPPAAAAPAS